jgi:hypothetical protein
VCTSPESEFKKKKPRTSQSDLPDRCFALGGSGFAHEQPDGLRGGEQRAHREQEIR